MPEAAVPSRGEVAQEHLLLQCQRGARIEPVPPSSVAHPQYKVCTPAAARASSGITRGSRRSPTAHGLRTTRTRGGCRDTRAVHARVHEECRATDVAPPSTTLWS
ncbi:uncharacterized protein LOC144155311 [Haemaphysalis longicornis]